MSVLSRMKNINESVGSEKMVMNDFERRIPYWSYRPVSYEVYEPFKEYKTEIDGYLEKLFNGEIDDGNGDVLDNMIMDMARQAEKSLNRQRVEHRDMIKSLDIRAQSDRKAFKCQLELLKEQLENNKHNQEKYNKLADADEFIDRRRMYEKSK